MPVLVARQPDGYNVQIQSKNVKQKIYFKKKRNIDVKLYNKITINIPDMCMINTLIHIYDILIVLYQQKHSRLIRYWRFKIRDSMFANLHDFARFLHNCGEYTLIISIKNCLVSLEY